MLRVLLLLSVLISTSGCEAVMQNWQKVRMLDHLEQIESYHGTFSETGILDSKETLVTEIWYKAPLQYYMVIRAPKKFEGAEFSYDGNEIKIYYPQTRFAVVTRGLEPVSKSERAKLLKAMFDHGVKFQNYELGKISSEAGYPVIEVRSTERRPDAAIASGSSNVYDKFSFPISATAKFKNAGDYGFKYTSIQFNEAIDLPKVKIPKDAIVSEWDAKSKSFTEAEAVKDAGFKFNLPKLPEWKLARIIRQTGPVPAFTAMYDAGPFKLSVVVSRNYGMSLIPTGRGLKVPVGKVTGALIPNPHVNSYSFIHGETQYVLSTNGPIELILEAAKSIAP
ncbi:MAG TPA: hypothetical protein VM432_11140 [Bdellovibrionales bacterium]|nr:hypothetical protein [Bdellovibrionales bacterium]